MTEIVRGFRGKIPSGVMTVDMNISGPAVYDFSCFGVDEDDKLSDDRYMIFYNQTSSPNSEITYSPYENGARFTLDTFQLPASIVKLVFTVSIDGRGKMGEISSHTVSIKPINGEIMALKLEGSDFQNERAIISVEIYKRDGWRIWAVASGFNGGLGELLKHYGGEEASSNYPSHDPVPAPSPEPSHAPVILTKGQKVSLEKKPLISGEIIINLDWHKGNDGAIDLDLGCLYEMKDGKKGSVQALGNNFGKLDSYPYIALDADDRTGDREGGENLRVNAAEISRFKRILLYSFIYEGIANWREADGVATVRCPGNPDVIVKLDDFDTSDIMCAVAMLENVDGKTFSVEKIIKFFSGHSEMDKHYSWGLRWVKSKK